jgi:hypothetical protein
VKIGFTDARPDESGCAFGRTIALQAGEPDRRAAHLSPRQFSRAVYEMARIRNEYDECRFPLQRRYGSPALLNSRPCFRPGLVDDVST